MSNAMDRTVVKMKDFRPHLHDGVHALTSRAKSAAQTTDGFVRSNPWAAVGIVASLGLIAGLATTGARLLRRRRMSDAAKAAAAAAN